MDCDLISSAIEYIEGLFKSNSGGHDAAHSLRVYRNAMLIASREKDCDLRITALAALLHDADDHKLFCTENNANARAFLASRGVSSEDTERICAAINSVSFSKNGCRAPETSEGKIVQDADRLDAIGAVGVARTFAYGGEHGRSLELSIRHFYDKLLLLKDGMNTCTAKAIAEERHAFLETFLAEFESERGTMDIYLFDAGFSAYKARDWDRAEACFSGPGRAAELASAYLFLNREDDRQSPEKAFAVFERLAADNDPIACTDLGFCYCFGIGCGEDGSAGFSMYKKAAELGFPRAMNNLAVCFITGCGTEPDPQKAIEWLLKAGGESDGMVLCNLGTAYSAAGDPQRAESFYRRAAALGDPKAIERLRGMGADVSAFSHVEPDLDEVLFGELRELLRNG